jgi:hypothetical protein
LNFGGACKAPLCLQIAFRDTTSTTSQERIELLKKGHE